ncbi:MULTISPECIES: hypothetical protein [unclassified Microcoleus]|uniref:hypothetical protein n=1 Tax=unclassified Microcoleus TaxID=2642155 RepID=UPI002FD46F9C
MEPVSNESQQSSQLANSPLNSDSQVVPPPATGQLQQNLNSPEPPSLSLSFLGWQILAGKWVFLGIVVFATACTFFIFTKGSQFCLFSISCTTASGDTTATNFLGFLGGAATIIILTNVLGVPLVPAVAVAMGIWLLMQF